MKITRGRVAVAAAICLVSAATALQASEAMKAIVGSYLEIQAQLATDKIDGIKAPAAAIASRAEALGDGWRSDREGGEGRRRSRRPQGRARGVRGLSDAVIAAAKAEGWKDLGDTKLAFCPMVKRSWLQKDEKIRNPYFGSTMLECGEFKKP